MWLPLHRLPSFINSHKKRQGEVYNHSLPPSIYLPKPNTEKLECENQEFEDLNIVAGHSSMQGLRRTMEDDHIIIRMDELPDHMLFGILDGHAGTFTASFSAEVFPVLLQETPQWKKYCEEYKKIQQHQQKHGDKNNKDKAGLMNIDDLTNLLSQAMVQGYLDLDKKLRTAVVRDGVVCDESGSTMVTALVTPTHIICANVGDSRCIFSNQRQNTIAALTDDHKPNLPFEAERIKAAGGFVKWNRVNGELAMSRAIGDFRYKVDPNLTDAQYLVISYPDVTIQKRDIEDDSCLVIACDGVWDEVENDEAVELVTTVLDGMVPTYSESDQESNSNPLAAANFLIDYALSKGSTDNISAVIVQMKGKRVELKKETTESKTVSTEPVKNKNNKRSRSESEDQENTGEKNNKKKKHN